MIARWLRRAGLNFLVVFSFVTYGALEEPFELRVLTPVNPFQFERGLCPGHSLAPGDPQLRVPGQQPLVGMYGMVRQIVELERALYSAQAVYQMPDLESVESGAELVKRVPEFLNTLPAGYRFYSYFSEPEAGMKYMLLEPIHPNDPLVLAVAGTQSALDWVVDLDLGRAQMLKLHRIFRMFTTCQFLDSKGLPLAAKDLIITGHSLGGGLAQALAYQIQKYRLQSLLKPLGIRLVTFNGFGAQELIEKDEVYQPEIATLVNAHNFFVAGDVVSRIGRHIGPTYRLGPLLLSQSPSLSEMIELHSLEMVTELSLSDSVEQAPPFSGWLNRLAKWGHVTRIIPDLIYQNNEDRILELLSQAAALPMEAQTRQYIRRLIFAREMSLLDDGHSADTLYVKQLRKLRQGL